MSDNLSSVLRRFRVAATDFIEAVDSAPHLEREAFLARMSRCLAELYASALYLPVVQPDTASIDETSFPREERQRLYRSLLEKISPLDAYWQIFDSTEKENPVQGSLAGDISEIYCDLKQSLHLREKWLSQADFLWQLRFDFRSHWGKHLLGALAAIHWRYSE